MDENLYHFQWIVNLANRILLHGHEEKEKPLLSISFAQKIQKFDLPEFDLPKNVDDLKDGKAYLVLASVFSNITIDSNNFINNFQSVILVLGSIGYKPQQPCSPENLANGILQDHLNLCEIFEFAISDKSLDLELLVSDLRRLPRSFFVLQSRPNFLEDALSLWLSKFPCLHTLPDIKNMQEDISKGMHIAGILARIFPTRIQKNSIHCVISEENKEKEIKENWDLIKPVLDELGVLVPEKFPIYEKLFLCFIADIVQATRTGAKKFVRLDPPPPPVVTLRPLSALDPFMQRAIQAQKPVITVPLAPKALEQKRPFSAAVKIVTETKRPKTTEARRRKQTLPSAKAQSSNNQNITKPAPQIHASLSTPAQPTLNAHTQPSHLSQASPNRLSADDLIRKDIHLSPISLNDETPFLESTESKTDASVKNEEEAKEEKEKEIVPHLKEIQFKPMYGPGSLKETLQGEKKSNSNESDSVQDENEVKEVNDVLHTVFNEIKEKEEKDLFALDSFANKILQFCCLMDKSRGSFLNHFWNYSHYAEAFFDKVLVIESTVKLPHQVVEIAHLDTWREHQNEKENEKENQNQSSIGQKAHLPPLKSQKTTGKKEKEETKEDLKYQNVKKPTPKDDNSKNSDQSKQQNTQEKKNQKQTQNDDKISNEKNENTKENDTEAKNNEIIDKTITKIENDEKQEQVNKDPVGYKNGKRLTVHWVGLEDYFKRKQQEDEEYEEQLKMITETYSPTSPKMPQRFSDTIIGERQINRRETTVIPNYQTIVNALRFNALPGPSHEKEVEDLSELLKKYKNYRILILNASRTMKFKGIYIQDDKECHKIYGKGPDIVSNKDVQMFFKFLTGTKSYTELKVKSFTQTTDAFSLMKSLEPQTW